MKYKFPLIQDDNSIDASSCKIHKYIQVNWLSYIFTHITIPLSYEVGVCEEGGLGIIGFTLSVCLPICPSIWRWHRFRSPTWVYLGILIANFTCILFEVMVRSLFDYLIFSDVANGRLLAILVLFVSNLWEKPIDFDVRFKMAIPDFLLSGLTLVWLWISTPNFSTTLLASMGRNLLILSDVRFEMAAWCPFRIFGLSDLKWSLGGHIGFFPNLILIWLWKSTPDFISTLAASPGRSLLILSDIHLWSTPLSGRVGVCEVPDLLRQIEPCVF